MNLLIIGGTRFIGRHFVEGALKNGHRVTLFNRGKTNADPVSGAEMIRGDRDQQADLDQLRAGKWDAVLDTCGYIPRHVTMLAETLKDRVEHYAFISSISVYQDPVAHEADEDVPLKPLDDPAGEQVTGERYGGLKVLGERAADAVMPGRVLHIRPGFVVGSYDPTDRFTYWADRIARGGEVLVPGAMSRRVQMIHGADLGAFMLKMIEDRATGVYNAVNPAHALTWGEWMDTTRRATGSDARFTFVSDAFLTAQGVTVGELPFWVAPPDDGVLAVSNQRAMANGLTSMPLEMIVAETLNWSRSRPADYVLKAGLSAQREGELLSAWRSASE